MKKFIAILLCLTMLIPFAVLPAFAAEDDTKVKVASDLESAFVEGENSLIVFVTGIGQSHSYLFDESYLAEDAFENGTLQDYENYAPLIAEHKYKASWNLFNNNIGDNIKDPAALKAAARIVMHLLFSMFTRKNTIKDTDVNTLVRALFKYNLVDDNGQSHPALVTPRYVMPLSEYPGVIESNGSFYSEGKDCFYRSIPCAEICEEKLGANYEDYIYCYNYCAFSYPTQNVDGLHDFVEQIVADNKVGAKDVILVPMSMGASVVSAYLAKYPTVAENHVKRVVSIVGCWKGSDIMYDLITKSYADNSRDLFYNGLLGELVGEPWGYLVNIVLRIFPQPALRAFIDQAIGCVVDNIMFDAPSLLALVPDANYEEVRALITKDNILKEFDTYHEAQSTIETRLPALEAQGVTFSFLSGYGLPFGAITSDYKMFGFMKHAATTNSDEIINVSSTAPGTSYVAYNEQFADEEGRILSPDRSIDIAKTYYKDSTWFFHGQKHELEYNNTAIELAIELALGNIKTVSDCDNLAEDGVYYPQFNDARNLKNLKRSYIPDLERYCASTGYVLTEEQQAKYDEVIAMTENTVNDYEADNALMDDFREMLVEIGVYTPTKAPSKFSTFFNKTLKKANDTTYKVFGAKGFLDFCVD